MNMAKRTGRSRKTHAQTKWEVGVPGLGGNRLNLIAVDACLSKLNHRLYRQGRIYRAKVSLDASDMPTVSGTAQPFPQSPQAGTISVYALMNTWYVHAMWKQAKRAYDMALSDEEKALAKSNIARWRDFRVDCGLTTTVPNIPEGLNPQTFGSPSMAVAAFGTGMFELSTVENLDNGNNMTFGFGAGTATKFSLQEEYSLTRNESASPQTVITEMPYNELIAEGEDADYQELQANGSEPPYNPNDFPHAVWVKVGELGAASADLSNLNGSGAPPLNTTRDRTQVVWKSSTGYFDAPLGMIAVDNHMTDGEGVEFLTPVTVEVQSGTYLGVHAPVMG